MLSSIKQVKVGRGNPMLCIRSIVHYINIYSRIVIQLNMYVKIITSSGFKSTILTDFVQGQLRVPFRFGRCLKFPGSTLIYRKLSSPPQALRLRARLDTKWKKNRSRIYDLGVVPTRGNKRYLSISILNSQRYIQRTSNNKRVMVFGTPCLTRGCKNIMS